MTKGDYSPSDQLHKITVQLLENKIDLFKQFKIIFLCAHICTHVSLSTYRERSEDILGELFLSFQHAGPEDGTQVGRLVASTFTLLSHPVPKVGFYHGVICDLRFVSDT